VTAAVLHADKAFRADQEAARAELEAVRGMPPIRTARKKRWHSPCPSKAMRLESLQVGLEVLLSPA
jgi:hypothetical protein